MSDILGHQPDPKQLTPLLVVRTPIQPPPPFYPVPFLSRIMLPSVPRHRFPTPSFCPHRFALPLIPETGNARRNESPDSNSLQKIQSESTVVLAVHVSVVV
ncbi:hypothetical protein Enr13x_43300 [Stieleria neptunia]|uniref:Uncharacterized protein n=1 Tax=Stieleria neptunia TaxID=2527979 RepID=A0A518HUH2_9BACT|nr:hypothetical protein Enr13x_43300 [Stieleria neptunia]